MTMAPGQLCGLCRGACCEDVAMGLEGIPGGQLEFLRFRGATRDVTINGRVIQVLLLPHRCQHLTKLGLCDAYEGRPAICRDLEEGGPTCLAVIRRRRQALARELVKS